MRTKTEEYSESQERSIGDTGSLRASSSSGMDDKTIDQFYARLEKWKQLDAAAQNFQTAEVAVFDRFRDMLRENWRTLDHLTQLSAMADAYEGGYATVDEGGGVAVVELPNDSMPEYANAARDFQRCCRGLIDERDNPDTPLITARMIEIGISDYGVEDENFWLFELDDPIVQREMRRNYERVIEADDNGGRDADGIYEDSLMSFRLRHRVDHEDDPSLFLIKTAGLYHYLNEGFGVDVASLSNNTRLHLLEYMTTMNKGEYARIEAIAHRLSQDGRMLFAEAFLATEFGDDYGDALLDITEHASPEQSAHILETVNSLRTRTSEFAKMFHSIDQDLATATEKALNERITDTLIALQEVAVKGNLHADVAPHYGSVGYVHDGRFDIDVQSIDEAIEIIDGLEKTFGTMHEIFAADDLKITKVNSNEDQFVLYRLMSKSMGNMLIYIRPKGGYGYDEQIEYGNRKGVEASISFVVDPASPHKLLMPKDPDAVSIRFDHEGRLVSEPADSDRRDPTRKDGLISADVSSGMGKSDTLPVRIGRLIAAGNRIRARRIGTEDSLHHNTKYFDQEKYGDGDGFAYLARSVIRQIELMKKALHSKALGSVVGLAAKSAESGQADLPKAA